MSNNSTKKSKQSLKQLQKQLKATIKIWSGTADHLEKEAERALDEGTKEALYLPAAIYRTCCVDLEAVVSGEAILFEEDAAKLQGVVANN